MPRSSCVGEAAPEPVGAGGRGRRCATRLLARARLSPTVRARFFAAFEPQVEVVRVFALVVELDGDRRRRRPRGARACKLKARGRVVGFDADPVRLAVRVRARRAPGRGARRRGRRARGAVRQRLAGPPVLDAHDPPHLAVAPDVLDDPLRSAAARRSPPPLAATAAERPPPGAMSQHGADQGQRQSLPPPAPIASRLHQRRPGEAGGAGDDRGRRRGRATAPAASSTCRGSRW